VPTPTGEQSWDREREQQEQDSQQAQCESCGDTLDDDLFDKVHSPLRSMRQVGFGTDPRPIEDATGVPAASAQETYRE
jgi:hypothetical protein